MNAPTIQDHALDPGHVVRQMLEEAGTHLPATASIDTATAARVLDMSEDRLRKRYQRWAVMARPPVRVTCTPWPGSGAPGRRRLDRMGEGAGSTTVRVPTTGNPLSDTVAHLQDVVTRNLKP